MEASKLSNYSNAVVNTFWIGALASFYRADFLNNPDTEFMYKITIGTTLTIFLKVP